MRRLLNVSNFVPAGVFLGFAVYYLFKIKLSLSPSDPLSWQLYLSISPLFNKASSLFASIGAVYAAILLGLIGVAGFAAANSKAWGLFRFAYFHAALLVVFAGLSNRLVFSASADANFMESNKFAFHLPNLSSVEPSYCALLLIIFYACAKIHRSMIWTMRHPVRSIAPVEI